MASSENEKDLTQIVYLCLAIGGLYALSELWTAEIRPWIESTWGELRAGNAVTLPLVGSVDRVDIIGVAVLAVPFVLILAFAAGAHRRRRRNRARTRANAPGPVDR
jgi:hypothetical protein